VVIAVAAFLALALFAVPFPVVVLSVLALQLPNLTTPRWVAIALTGLAAVLLFRLRWSVLRTLGVCAVLGLDAGLAGLPVS
jgi:chromate transporter